ncbi:hypothetical protein PGTUg99_020082 [Puccinia graminis f. sp. tritici]|uniref:Uncharacterized protein n=1 Tax=Puccinia graminis f. sp. tritici TaxID=56615 RepID=A0A5B0RNC3_PUCGR|nr:hypothetical protein PGTUg99_020082 [Puccinia graminis f. sp. tritici]
MYRVRFAAEYYLSLSDPLTLVGAMRPVVYHFDLEPNTSLAGESPEGSPAGSLSHTAVGAMRQWRGYSHA